MVSPGLRVAFAALATSAALYFASLFLYDSLQMPRSLLGTRFESPTQRGSAPSIRSKLIGSTVALRHAQGVDVDLHSCHRPGRRRRCPVRAECHPERGQRHLRGAVVTCALGDGRSRGLCLGLGCLASTQSWSVRLARAPCGEMMRPSESRTSTKDESSVAGRQAPEGRRGLWLGMADGCAEELSLGECGFCSPWRGVCRRLAMGDAGWHLLGGVVE
jgi:hypothetical protein